MQNTARILTCATLALTLTSSLATADVPINTCTANGLALAIPDDAYNGTLASMAHANLTVSGPAGSTITSATVVLSMTHTWVGDLTIKLVAPDGTVITLMSRPGFVESADDGTGGAGDSSNLLNAFPITFHDGAGTSAELMGNSIGTSGAVCRDDATCTFAPANGAAPAGNLASLIGKSPTGTWNLSVGDSELGDLGTLDHWCLNLTVSVPSVVPFCAGDGTQTDHTTGCPCANNGAAGHGCANSANASGAVLGRTGAPDTDDLVLLGSGMPATVSCIYLQGDALADVVFGDGVRCTGGSLVRLRTKNNVGGASSFPDSVETVTLSQRGGVTVGSGAVRYYQTYYRNSSSTFCPPETFNVTNGLTVTW